MSFMTVGAGAVRAQLACAGDHKPAVTLDLLFGRKIGDRIGVSDADFAQFVDAEITPRFPDGLTVIDALGQWRDRDTNKIVREPSKVVQIVLTGAADEQARIDAIVAAYKARFHQQAVGVVKRGACVAF